MSSLQDPDATKPPPLPEGNQPGDVQPDGSQGDAATATTASATKLVAGSEYKAYVRACTGTRFCSDWATAPAWRQVVGPTPRTG